MDTAGPESILRSVIADGLTRLDAAHGGRYLAEVARYLGVERSTVSRWRHQRSTAQADHCEALARRWPEHFARDELVDLQYRATRVSPGDELTVGVDVLHDPASILEAATTALNRDPQESVDRTYRHVAMHVDRNGLDPLDRDAMYQTIAGGPMAAFRSAVSARAAEGWNVRFVISAGNPKRFDSVANLVETVDGPNVEIFAYPLRLPLSIAPLVIANREVILSHDHRRWERPGAALRLRSTAVARWADNYVNDLAADAPFRLRDPAGPDPEALERFRRALR